MRSLVLLSAALLLAAPCVATQQMKRNKPAKIEKIAGTDFQTAPFAGTDKVGPQKETYTQGAWKDGPVVLWLVERETTAPVKDVVAFYEKGIKAAGGVAKKKTSGGEVQIDGEREESAITVKVWTDAGKTRFRHEESGW